MSHTFSMSQTFSKFLDGHAYYIVSELSDLTLRSAKNERSLLVGASVYVSDGQAGLVALFWQLVPLALNHARLSET